MFPSVSNVLAIFGGIASVNIVYIVPCKYTTACITDPVVFCYLKLRRDDDPITSPKNLAAIIYFSLMCLIGWGSSIGTLMMMLGSKTNPLLYC